MSLNGSPVTSQDVAAVVSATASVGTFFVATFALLVAYLQLNSWKEQRISARKAQLAEELLAEAHEAVANLRALRSPADYIPLEKLQEPAFQFRRRREQLREMHSLFLSLRRKGILAEALLDDPELRKSLEDIHAVRVDLDHALREIVSSFVAPQKYQSDRRVALLDEYEQIVWGGVDSDDKHTIMLCNAIQNIEAKLLPIIRLRLNH